MTIHRINAAGLDEIREALSEKLNRQFKVEAWAEELANALNDGKHEIEIRAIWTNSGRPEFLSVSEAGVDTEEIADE